MKLKQKIAVASIRTRLKILAFIATKKAARVAFTLFCTPQVRVIKPLPASFRMAEPLQLVFGGYAVAGYRWNKGQVRKVLILHGFESTAVNFEQYINPLVEKGYEVLAFDAPAHGRSGGKQINALVYRDFIMHIHEQYGPVQSFLGHSFGGLALCLALSEIDHGNDYRVALIAPATNSTTAMRHFFRFLHIRNARVKQQFEAIILAEGGHPLTWFSIPRTLEHIRASILWVHDEKDDITPVDDVLPVKKKNHPGLRFVFTSGLGHTKIYRDAAIARIVVDFL